MPRLAYISFDQVPAPKGAATHIEAFVRGLAAEFGAVDLVTVSGTRDATGPVTRWPGVLHQEFPAAGATLIDRVLSFGRLLSPWLAARQYDVIHFRSIFEGLPILKHRKRAALVFEVNGLPSIELKYRYPGSEDDRELMSKIEAQERACISAADRIVTPGTVTRDFLERSRGASRHRITVIPNGVDTTVFQPSGTADRAGLLYFGTLSSWQGVDLAIRAAAAAGSSLKIFGTGSRARRHALVQLAAKLGVTERVTLAPPVSQAELAQHLAACEAVLAPLPWNDRNALQGCCPLKVLEGMAAARPVISSDLEVVRQIGRHDEHLLLTKPGSVDGMVAAIERLRRDPALSEGLARNGRRLIEDRYTWRHANVALIEVYRDLLPRPEAARVPVRN